MITKKLSGQLWESCPKCGEEPIYLSNGGYCEKHGKKTTGQYYANDPYGDECKNQDE